LCPSTNTMRRWYIHYQQYGEIPEETKKRTQKRKRTTPEAETATKFTTQQLSFLKMIVDDSPHLYLDEISERYHQKFSDDSKSDCSIWNALTKRMNYRLKVYTEIALQRCEQERAKFDYALKLMVRNPNQVILIDETNKDKNAGRRRRILTLRGNKAEWKSVFAAKDNEDFSMIGAANLLEEYCSHEALHHPWNHQLFLTIIQLMVCLNLYSYFLQLVSIPVKVLMIQLVTTQEYLLCDERINRISSQDYYRRLGLFE